MNKELVEAMIAIRNTHPEIYGGYYYLLNALQLHMKINSDLLSRFDRDNPCLPIIQQQAEDLHKWLSELPPIPPSQ